MKILVACEESQAVTIELRKLGHEAYSCDILNPSGNHPEWHIKGDVIPLLNGNCSFTTLDGSNHLIVEKWDMLLAFPPCTHLSLSGAKHFEKKRADGRQREGIEFFCQFFEADCEKVAIENPLNIIKGGLYIKKWFPDLAEKYDLPRRETQIIQPYWFGDPYEKQTCIWLKGLPLLIPSNIVDTPPRHKTPSGASLPAWYSKGGKDRQKNRSKTFQGVAKAMAEQWAGKSDHKEISL